MKRMMLAAVGVMMVAGLQAATTFTLWNFNSNPPDTSTSTGTKEPASGIGSIGILGVSESFAQGSPNDGVADNTGLSTSGYPAQGTGNKSAGIQVNVSTVGYSNVVVTFEQRNSNTGSKYGRFQYSVNGADFVDFEVITMQEPVVFAPHSVDLSSVPAVDNNPSFAFRIVSEFESTATGGGVDGYVATLSTSSYGSAGTVRFDLLSVSGAPMNAENTPPSIEPIPDLQTTENVPIVNQSIIVGDFETPPDELILRILSSNPGLIPAENVVITGSDFQRSLSITPEPDVYGEATITLTIVDGEGLTASVNFKVTVTPSNLPPTISGIPHQRIVASAAGVGLPFVVGDLETAANDLVVTAASSNPALISASGLALDGDGENRSVVVTPTAGVHGTSLVTLEVTDGGGRSSTSSFVVMVVPSDGVLLFENFGYADGSLVTNAARFWDAHSGNTGQVQLAASSIGLSFGQSEDVHAFFPADPLNTGSVYVSFDATFSALPLSNEYFAHLNASGNFRARIFSGTNNAAEGTFRLGVGNFGNTGIGQIQSDLSLGIQYKVVMRYNVENATSALWIDPESESDSAAMATDSTSATPINAFSFRNATGIGTMRIDNLIVGRSFADVVSGATERVRIEIAVVNDVIEVSWPASATGFRLQGNPGVDAADWMDEQELPAVENGRNIVRLPGVTGNRFFRLIQ